jgi:hypothetical protein
MTFVAMALPLVSISRIAYVCMCTLAHVCLCVCVLCAAAVIVIGELMKLAQRLVGDGLHPRIVSEGYELAKNQGLMHACRTRTLMCPPRRHSLVLKFINERKISQTQEEYAAESAALAPESMRCSMVVCLFVCCWFCGESEDRWPCCVVGVAV